MEVVIEIPEICPICLENLDSETITVWCCKRNFHKSCYNTWREIKTTCPICRHDFGTRRRPNIVYPEPPRTIIVESGGSLFYCGVGTFLVRMMMGICLLAFFMGLGAFIIAFTITRKN